jgi:dihydroflavonol-4-reductase
MNIVTGGTGLLGSHILFELSKNEAPIKAFYRNKDRCNSTLKLFLFYDPINGQKLFDRIDWVQCDVLDIPQLEEEIVTNSTVYHCAALVSFHPKDFNQLLKTNKEGTSNIVNVCIDKKIKKLCYVSSTAAIGGEDNKLITEETKWKNSPETSGYSISKYCAEREVWRGIEEGLNAVIINPCVILGPGNWNESSLTIFNTVKKGIRFYPPGANATVDARDVATSLIKLGNSDIQAERFLCIGSNQSFKELTDEIATQLNVTRPKKQVSKWMVNVARRILSFVAWITRSRSSITKETVNSLFGIKSYSAEKLHSVIDVKFHSLKEQVQNSIKGRQF